ncbi:MAG: tetratricopeptide repeat protein, partial [Candidatus Eiseniibacteriota bacterium]
AYVVADPSGGGASTPGRKAAPQKATPQSAAGNAGLFLILGLIIGGGIGYALHGATGPREQGGMPKGPSDVMRGAGGSDAGSGMGGDAGAGMGGDAGSGMGGAPAGGGMGGGAPSQMPPQVVAMVQQYRAALAKDPNDVDANIGFGNLLFDSSQWEKAVDHYGRALAKNPRNADVRVDRAIALHNLDRNDEAKVELERVTREQPTHRNGWLNLGVVDATIGDRPGAIAAWEQYLKLDPNGEHAEAIRAQIQELKKSS